MVCVSKLPAVASRTSALLTSTSTFPKRSITSA